MAVKADDLKTVLTRNLITTITAWEKQYKVGSYRIDLYSKKYNVAIEYDEEQHSQERNIKKDIERQIYIEAKIKNIVFNGVKKGFETEGINKILKHILNAR